MKVLDLFAGIGGFSLASHWMGWETAAFVEWDKFCQKVLAKNFPGVPIYGDITEFDGTPFRGSIDLITGGFPCQPFSAAGKQKGKEDQRYLFPEMLRVIDDVRPRYIVAENVRGLLSIENGDVFTEICSQLEGQGYDVWTFNLPASSVEAPHERQRLWIVARNSIDSDDNADRTERGSLRETESLSGIGGTPMGSGVSLRTDRNASYITSNPAGDGPSLGRSETRGAVGSSEQRRVYESQRTDRDASNADSCGHDRRGQQGSDRERSVHPGCGNDTSFGESSIGNCKPSDSSDKGSPRSRSQPQSESTFNVSCHPDRKETAYPSNPNTDGLQRLWSQRYGQGSTGLRNREGQDEASRNWSTHWLEVATALCRMDDGISAELDFPRDNRVNRLKALGNSIVPQIALEIFRSIEAADNPKRLELGIKYLDDSRN